MIVIHRKAGYSHPEMKANGGQSHEAFLQPDRRTAQTLVDAIGQGLNTSAEYLGVPTFAYEVGGYHIDKNGTFTGNDKLDLADALHQKGLKLWKGSYVERNLPTKAASVEWALFHSVEELCGVRKNRIN
jgi:hypothetical protein